MAREVQIRRGSAADNAGFTGLEGELIYLTDSKVLVAHDGVTPGGFAMIGGSNFQFGSHTPTPTLGTNVSAASIDFGGFSRIGDRVHVSGHGEVDFTAGADTDSEFSIELPIPFGVANEGEIYGMWILEDGRAGQIIADTPSDYAVFLIKAPTTFAIKFTYMFDYAVV